MMKIIIIKNTFYTTVIDIIHIEDMNVTFYEFLE